MANYGASLARKLHAWGINNLAATLLESGGPLPFFGAQALYMVAPLFGPATPENDAMALARILEDPEATRELIKSLSDSEALQH